MVRAISQSHAVQQLESLGARLALRTLEDLDGCLHDVLQCGLVREEIEALKHHANTRTLSSDLLIVALEERAARILAIAQQLTVDVHAAGADVLEHVQAAQERRLARARGAEDDADLAGSDIEVDAPQDVQVAEELVDSANGDHGRRSRHGVTSKNLSLVALASSSSSEEDDAAGEWVPALSRRSKPLP